MERTMLQEVTIPPPELTEAGAESRSRSREQDVSSRSAQENTPCSFRGARWELQDQEVGAWQR